MRLKHAAIDNRSPSAKMCAANRFWMISIEQWSQEKKRKKLSTKSCPTYERATGVSESQVKLVLIQTLLCLKLSSDACTLHYMHKKDSRERLCFGRVSELLCVCVFSPKWYGLQSRQKQKIKSFLCVYLRAMFVCDRRKICKAHKSLLNTFKQSIRKGCIFLCREAWKGHYGRSILGGKLPDSGDPFFYFFEHLLHISALARVDECVALFVRPPVMMTFFHVSISLINWMFLLFKCGLLLIVDAAIYSFEF